MDKAEPIILGNNSVSVNGDIYDVIPKEVNAATRAIEFSYNKVGRPTDPLSTAGKKVVAVMIAVWEDLYPEQSRSWFKVREEYKINEMSIKEQSRKKTGRSLASLPKPIYKMFQVLFPEFKLNNRDNFIKLCKAFPIFQFVNRI